MNYLKKYYPNYDCDKEGNVYKNGNLVKPFKSNNYLQVCLYDKDHVKKVTGVHNVIAMKYLDFFYDDNLIVHHKDENYHNNNVYNLQVLTNRQHCSLHRKKMNTKGRPSPFKGMKRSEEFRKKTSEGKRKSYLRKRLIKEGILIDPLIEDKKD